MSKKFIYFIIVLFLVFLSIRIYPCTIIMFADKNTILAGNNEDWQNPNTKIWFHPSSDKKYGRVYFGFDSNDVQGGMNDQGLFIDINAVDETDWKKDSKKLNFRGSIIEHILSNCADVNDVLDFFIKYNVKLLNTCKFPVADSRGNAAIIEWGQNKLQFIKRKGSFLVSTNFVQSNYKKGEYPPDTERYQMATKLLKDNNDVSINTVRSVLSATASEFYWPTIYSNICDLKNKKIYLYNFHNFEEVYIIDLKKHLKKGFHSYSIPSLFQVKTFGAILFDLNRIKSGKEKLLKIINKKGVDEAIKKYYELKQKQYRKIRRIDIRKSEINLLGYELMWDKRLDEAIKIFELNVKEHPKSWNMYDSLGEAYFKKGDIKLAIKNYKKSLELNPQNTNVEEVLKKIKKMIGKKS